MRLTRPKVPLTVSRALTASLAEFVEPLSPLGALIRNCAALPVYHLDLKPFSDAPDLDALHEIAKRAAAATKDKDAKAKADAEKATKALADAEAKLGLPKGDKPSGGWRFWAASGSLYGVCHVGPETDGATWKVTGVSNSVQVLTAIQIYTQIEQHPDLIPLNFEPRILRVPWYPLEAFWLHSEDTKVEDRFVVFMGFQPGKMPDPPDSWPWSRFRQELLKRAKSKRFQPGKPVPPPSHRDKIDELKRIVSGL